MNILLINTNPIVSRLFCLSLEEEDMILYEVQKLEEIEPLEYDVVFLDDASYTIESEVYLLTLKKSKRVLISYHPSSDIHFEEVMKKPFLPSKIMQIIKNFQEPLEPALVQDKTQDLLSAFSDLFKPQKNPIQTNSSILDSNEIEKIKSLLEMDKELNDDIALEENEYEAKKVEVITEQLKADGLEIIEEKEILHTLTQSKAKKKKKKFLGTPEQLEQIEEAIEIMMTKLSDKKMEKLFQGEEIKIKLKLQDIKI